MIANYQETCSTSFTKISSERFELTGKQGKKVKNRWQKHHRLGRTMLYEKNSEKNAV